MQALEVCIMRKVFLAASAAVLALTFAAPAFADPYDGCDGFLSCITKKRQHNRQLAAQQVQVQPDVDPQLVDPQPLPPVKQPKLMQQASAVAPKDQPVYYNPQRKADGTPILVGSSRRETVNWAEDKYQAGTIIVKTPERALYYVLGGGKALRYAVGVGKEGFQWSGTSIIAAKAEWPGWTPPAEMITREKLKGHIIPPHMDGGPDNPLGARALYLGGRMYRIHGTNNEASIGGDVSSGCIRMMNADIIDLYNRAKIGGKVIVLQ